MEHQKITRDIKPWYYEAAWTEIRRRRTTVQAIAKKIGRRREHVSSVLNGKLDAPPTEKLLLEELGISVPDVSDVL